MIKTKKGELDLNDPQTVEMLKASDVVAPARAKKRTPRPNTFSMHFSDEQVERLSRLTNSGNWQDALTECIEALLVERVGRAVISSPSQYSQKITGPSAKVRYQ